MKRVISLLIVLSLLLSGKCQILMTNGINLYAGSKETDTDDLNLMNLSKESLNLHEDGLFSWNGGSSVNGDNRIISAEFEYANLTYSDIENKATFYYTDDYFKNDSTVYNNHLSTMSIGLALSGVGNVMEDKKDKYGNAKDILSKIGFENITPNDYFLNDPEETSMGTLVANKHIYLKDASGSVNEYNLFAIVERSANYKDEWVSNFKIGNSGDHEGFSESRDIVYDFFTEFYNEHRDDYGNIPVKIWMTGYSRGAAVTNMLGGKVTDNASNFNTRKEDIYCYTLGTPKGVLISAHTESLDSYTNIHNVVSPADLFALVVPETFGFGRYGVDHLVPCFRSDKVHNAAERAEAQRINQEYMVKYNKMLKHLRKLEPTAEVDINDFKMYELTLIDFATFQYLVLNRLGEGEFIETSNESEYYQAYEFFRTFVNDFVASDVFSCDYQGTDYGTITKRDRYYQKYQDILCWLAKTFLSGNSNTNQIISKIRQNAENNALFMFGLVLILKELVYSEGEPQPRNHFILNYNPDETYEESNYNDAYEICKPVYEKLFEGVFSESDYNFLISHNKDITDFILDLLNADYRTSYLPKKSSIGTIYQNAAIVKALHINAYYLAWLQSEDEYFDTEPANTIKYNGTKTLTFTDLSNSTIELYDENNNKISEYNITSTDNMTYNEIISDKYIDVVKSYNPEGLEIRLPSDTKARAVIKANNKSIGNVIYREYFVADAEFYRKEKSLGNVFLNANECYEVSFDKSSVTSVYSCYKKNEISGFKAATFKSADIKGVEVVYGMDSFTYANEPTFEKKAFATSMLATTSMINSAKEATGSEITGDTVSTDSEIILDVLSTDSEIFTDKIPTESEIINDDVNVESKIDDALSTESEIYSETHEQIKSSDGGLIVEQSDNSDGDVEDTEQEHFDVYDNVATESDILDDVEENEFDELDIKSSESEIDAEEYSDAPINGFTDTDTEKYAVNFKSNAEGIFYYFDGENYVEGKNGDKYAVGTKIKFTAPFSYDGRPFYGWTLSDGSGRYLNKKGVDTPKIIDESDAENSTYVLEIKNYDINILANYQYKEYTLKLSVDSSKGNISPDDATLKYNSVDDFDLAKVDITVDSVSPFTFLSWSDGMVNYKKLSDYNWQYKSDVTLEAVFEKEEVKPVPPSGGGGNGGGGGGISGIKIGPIDNVPYVKSVIFGVNIHNDVQSGTWEQDLQNLVMAGKYRYKIDNTTYLNNGVYRINNRYYMFDANGYMLTGIQSYNNNIYYFEEFGSDMGAMVQGEKNINGITYTFGENGILTVPNGEGLKVVSGEWIYYPITNTWEYYAYGNGGSRNKLVNGLYSIKNTNNTYTNYLFDANGVLVE